MDIAVTVNDILSLKSFADVYVKAGAEGMSNVVENVFFMEVPDIYKYVDPFGLLLTTLYPIANDKEAIGRFIPNLVEKQVSCVALKLGRYIHDVPPVMLEQADRFRMPLMILPNNANLSKLSNDILGLFLGSKTSMLEYRDNIHSKLMGLLLEGADLHKLVKTVSDLFSLPVLVVDRYFHLQSASFAAGTGYSLSKGDDSVTWDEALSGGRLTVHASGTSYSGLQVLYRPIADGSENLGYLIALLEEDADATNLTIGLEQASMLCAFLFQRELAMRQTERNYLDSFIRDMFSGKFPHQQEAEEKAKFFDWDLTFPMTVLAIEVLEAEQERQRSSYADLLAEGIVEQELTAGLGLGPRSCKIVHRDDALLCLISLPGGQNLRERLKERAEGILAYYKDKYKLGIGISNPAPYFERLKDAKDEAKFVLDMINKLRGPEPFVAFYAETGIYKLLHHISETDALSRYVEEKLGFLLNNGGKESELLETLLCLLKNGFNLQKTAKELFIHYNTLRYRLDKLKEYGIDTGDGLELAELALAYQMHTYLLAESGRKPVR
ncbi:PucR family transcriptional regulator [Paenibacillus tepidiphilus]|uniref:PucR family transcriptional regulator n=1 Tax=Paenibacillus tepidiphilus TaxID=2608683 RepID=UPI00123A308E|nr:PucR family transcriptional regulator [Paenibacillus tepidiphilus]